MVDRSGSFVSTLTVVILFLAPVLTRTGPSLPIPHSPLNTGLLHATQLTKDKNQHRGRIQQPEQQIMLRFITSSSYFKVPFLASFGNSLLFICSHKLRSAMVNFSPLLLFPGWRIRSFTRKI